MRTLTRPATLLGRTYERDDDGRFGHGSGGGGGGGTPTEGGILPEALTGLTTVSAVNDAAKIEAKRITGRDTEFALEGDHHVAAEHAAAILHGMSEFPGTRLDRVQTGDFEDNGAGAYAMTSKDGHTITFARDAQSPARGGPDGYRADLAKDQAGHHLAVGSPAGVALHEFGHAVANGGKMNEHVAAQARDYAEGALGSQHYGATVSQHISRRAASSDREMIAESFAAVSWHGDGASKLAHEVVDSMRVAAELGPMDAATRAVIALQRPATLLGRTYTRDDKGRFGHGSGGGGVRDSLAQAKTLREIADVTAGELKTILGNDVRVNLQGLEPEMARLHMEGVLRAAEFHPVGVGELQSIGTMPEGQLNAAAGQPVVAITIGSSIVFSQGYDTARLSSSQELADAFVGGTEGRYMAGERGDLTRIGAHEYGHIVMRGPEVRAATNRVLADAIRKPGETPKAFVSREISQYGASKMNELMAEAFLDVVSAGPGASATSKAIVSAALPGSPTALHRGGLQARTYKRDSAGRFGSGGGSGVRDSLASVEGTDAVAAVCERELSKIQGHFVSVSFTGMSPDVARETAEGVLRCAEAYPTTRLSRIDTYGVGGDQAIHPGDPTGTTSFAVTRFGGMSQRADEISFNISDDEPTYRASIRVAHEGGFLVPSDPMGVAMHEMGHVVAHRSAGSGGAFGVAEAHAQAAGVGSATHVRAQIGRYAAQSAHELEAESFAQVMIHGDKASPLAKDIVHEIERGYDADAKHYGEKGWPVAREYKRDKDGRFGSGGGTATDVRESLAAAKSLGQINDAAAAEAKRITGRDIEFAMAHSDPVIARQHVEGVLRGLEAFPGAPLAKVDDYAPSGDRSIPLQGKLAQAYTVPSADGATIRFNGRYAGDPARYEREQALSEADGFIATPHPMGTAMHEFGHVLTIRPSGESSAPRVPARKIAQDMIRENGRGKGYKKVVTSEISGYAATGSHELAAESIAQVLTYGQRASPIALAIYRSTQSLYPGSADPAAGHLPVLPNARTYKRDDHGRFGSGSGGVRDSLAKATTVDEVSAVLASEASALAGRKVRADLTGSDLQIAREHAEGVLQGFERYPKADVQQIISYGPDSGRPEAFPDFVYAYAVAGVAPTDSSQVAYVHTIGFSNGFAAHADRYRESLDSGEALTDTGHAGHAVPGGPTGTALHEFGHHVVRQTRAATASKAIVTTRAREAGEKPSARIRREVSGYAATNNDELAAEAFADVMVHGAGASVTSHAIMHEVDTRYTRDYGPPNGLGRAIVALSRPESMLTTRGRVVI